MNGEEKATSVIITANVILRDFLAVKIYYFIRKFFIYFFLFAQYIDCGYMLELPRRDGYNEYPKFMFWNKSNKTFTPMYLSFSV